MMEIAKSIYKDSGASCWPLKIDGVPLIEYNFDTSDDVIHEVEWSPSQNKSITFFGLLMCSDMVFSDRTV